jgi:hypothetical protein
VIVSRVRDWIISDSVDTKGCRRKDVMEKKKAYDFPINSPIVVGLPKAIVYPNRQANFSSPLPFVQFEESGESQEWERDRPSPPLFLFFAALGPSAASSAIDFIRP